MWIKCVVTLCILVAGQAVGNKKDFLQEHMSWECANNATCFKNVARMFVQKLHSGETIDLGVASVESLPKKPFTGRSAGWLNFLSGHALRIPIGPMVFSVQRSDDYHNYLEVALLKKAKSEGREGGSDHGGGHGGGIGGGHGGGHGGGLGGHGGHKDHKHMQMFIPTFLMFNAVGWMLLAMKAVAVLTFKALVVSKVAFIVAAGIIMKKMMENSQEKMIIPHHFEHQEHLMMPYNMEYSIPSHSYHGGELSAHPDLYAMQMAGGGGVGGGVGHDVGVHHGLEHIAAESSMNHLVALNNNTAHSMHNLDGSVTKVKRQDELKDMWSAIRRKPAAANSLTQRNPIYVYRGFQ